MLDLERLLGLLRLVEAGFLAAGDGRPEERQQQQGDRAHPAIGSGSGRAILPRVQVIALFGPTGVGKTAVAIALAGRLREAGENPVAIAADALQVYEGLEILTGAATASRAAAPRAPAARVRAD